MKTRCNWCAGDPLYTRYHDLEWGVPVHNDRKLFEFLVLEGAQAGLSWITILRKRPAYRQAFDKFDFNRIARYRQTDFKRLLVNEGIVRNRLKIQSVINNARAFLEVRAEFVSFNRYFWQFTNGEPLINHWQTLKQVPASTRLSESISKDLKSRGFTFVGPTICYAFMQAVGMVNDHITSCFRYGELARGRSE